RRIWSRVRRDLDTDCLDHHRPPGAAAHPHRPRGARIEPPLGNAGDAMSAELQNAAVPPRRRLLVALPLLVFLALAALFFSRLGPGDPSPLPAALTGRGVPAPPLPPGAGLERDGQPVPGLGNADLHGTVSVLNVWASWCVPCHDEAPLLL